jgi:hypothetical protein
MSSLWKDLLFVQGHVVRKEDLAWRPDTRPDTGRNATDAEQAGSTASARPASRCRTLHWPRLSVPH